MATRRPARAPRLRRLTAATRGACRVVWLIGCLAAIAAAGALSVATSVLDVQPLAVLSGSMEPALPVHSLILVEKVPASEVAVGDIITFDPPGATPRVTHRVVARRAEASRWYFTTRGDANPAPDDWRRSVSEPARHRSDITYGDRPAIRHVATIPHAGWLMTLGGSAQARTAVFAALLTWLAFRLLLAIWMPVFRASRPAGGQALAEQASRGAA